MIGPSRTRHRQTPPEEQTAHSKAFTDISPCRGVDGTARHRALITTRSHSVETGDFCTKNQAKRFLKSHDRLDPDTLDMARIKQVMIKQASAFRMQI